MKLSAIYSNRPRRQAGTGLGLLLLAAAAAPILINAEEEPKRSAQAFAEQCAVCHGMSGEGDGPYADMLRSKPADLTVLSRDNAGKFPQRRVELAIDGRYMLAAHGVSDMPIWGRRWDAEAGRLREAGIKARLLVLTTFLRSIQK